MMKWDPHINMKFSDHFDHGHEPAHLDAALKAEADKDGAQRYPSVAIMQSTLFEKIARPVGDAFRSQVRTTPELTTGIFRWSQRARWPVHPSQGVDRILLGLKQMLT